MIQTWFYKNSSFSACRSFCRKLIWNSNIYIVPWFRRLRWDVWAVQGCRNSAGIFPSARLTSASPARLCSSASPRLDPTFLSVPHSTQTCHPACSYHRPSSPSSAKHVIKNTFTANMEKNTFLQSCVCLHTFIIKGSLYLACLWVLSWFKSWELD